MTQAQIDKAQRRLNQYRKEHDENGRILAQAQAEIDREREELNNLAMTGISEKRKLYGC